MPKKTFYNLSEDKQKNILDQSIKEFAKATYNEVKIAAIIKSAGIPRSSFYDYFEDKMDLYKFILDEITEKKTTYFGQVQVCDDFFKDLKSHIMASVRFLTLEPNLALISKNLLADRKLLKEIYGDISHNSESIFESMVKKGIENGSIRQGVDVAFVGKTIQILSSELMFEGAQDPNKSFEEILIEISDKMIEFIRQGIGK